MSSTKKILIFVLGLLLISGVTFVYSQRDSLLGSFSGMKHKPTSGVSTTSSTIEEAAQNAADSDANAKKYATDAATFATAAKTAWNNSDATALSSAQSAATQASGNAQTAADNAAEDAKQAQDYYDAAQNHSSKSDTSLKAAEEALEDIRYAADKADGDLEYAKTEVYIDTADSACGTSSTCAKTKSSNLSFASKAYSDFGTCMTAANYNQGDLSYACVSGDTYSSTNPYQSSACINTYKTSVSSEWGSFDTKLETALDGTKSKYNLDSLQSTYDSKESAVSSTMAVCTDALDTYNSAASGIDLSTAEDLKNAAYSSYQSALYDVDLSAGTLEYAKVMDWIDYNYQLCISYPFQAGCSGVTPTLVASDEALAKTLKLTFDTCISVDPDNKTIPGNSTTCFSNYSNSVVSKWPQTTLSTVWNKLILYYPELPPLQVDYTQKELVLSTESTAYQDALDNYNALYAAATDTSSTVDSEQSSLDAANASAKEAADYAAQALDSANLANSYKIVSCSSLTLDPSGYVMGADETSASFNLTAKLNAASSTTSFHFSLKNLMALSFVQPSSFSPSIMTTSTKILGPSSYPAQYKGSLTLSFETDGAGLFSATSSTGNNPLDVTKTDLTDTKVSFSGGVAGDTITASVQGQESACTASFTLTQTKTTHDLGGFPKPSQGPTLIPGIVDDTTDTDGDGLSDSDEATYGTDPNNPDTDSDGMPDGWEVKYGLDPLTDDSAGDLDKDGFTNLQEYQNGTDPSQPEPNVIISESNGSTDVTEDGTTDSYTLVLSSAPSADVTITATPDSQVTVAPATLTFTAENWNTAQTVTVSAIQDKVTEKTQSGLISHAATSSDTAYNAIAIKTVTANVSDTNQPLTGKNYQCSDPFTDTDGQWYTKLICRMYKGEVVIGKTSATFAPNDNVTTAEFIKIVDELLLSKTSADASGLSTTFTDVSGSDWYYSYVTLAEQADVIRTRDFGEHLNPNTPITRGVAAVYVARALGLSAYNFTSSFSDVPTTDFEAYAVYLLSNKTVDVPYDTTTDPVAVISGYTDGTFKPNDNIARSEATALIYRAYLAYLSTNQ